MRVPQSTLRVSEDAGSTPNVVAPRIAPVQDQTGEQVSMLGQGLAQAGAGVSRVADFLQDEMDDAVSQSVFNSYDEQSRQVAQRFRDSTGQDAITTYDQTIKQIATMRKDAEKRLQTQRQRQLFAARADSRDISLRGMLDGHAADQTRVFKIGALDAGSKNAMIAYQQAPLGSEEAKVQRELALRQQEEALRMQGKSKDEIQLARTLTLDSMHTGVLEAITEQDPKTARAYLDAHRGEVLPSTLRRAEANLERASLTETATRFTFDAEQQAAARGGTPAEQQAYAQAIADASYKGKRLTAEEYERTTQKIQQRFRQKRDTVALLAQDALGEAEKILSQNLDLRIDDLPQRILKPIEDGGHRDTINRFANLHRYVTDPEQFNATLAWGAKEHQDFTDAEFANYVKTIASGPQQARLMARRVAVMGSAEKRAQAVAWSQPKDIAERFVRRVMKPEVDALAVKGRDQSQAQQDFVEEHTDLIDVEWQKVNKDGSLGPQDFRKWLNTVEATVEEIDGRTIPSLFVPAARNQFAKVDFMGVPTERRMIPTAIEYEEPSGLTTLTREDIAKDLQNERMRANLAPPTPQEELRAWEKAVRAAPKDARKIIPENEEEARQRRELAERVLRFGAGGKR